MERGRMLFNGDLMFPKKGRQPPTPPPGYMPDVVDAWVMHKIYKTCKYRSFINTPTPCGIKRYTYFCSLDNTITNHIKCDPCTRSVEGESIQTNTDGDKTIRLADGSYL